jgi:hypothetical protein
MEVVEIGQLSAPLQSTTKKGYNLDANCLINRIKQLFKFPNQGVHLASSMQNGMILARYKEQWRTHPKQGIAK